VFTRCIFCHLSFQANETVEHFAVGRRIAYDPGRGRLWAVCDGCRRWSLAPIEDRWEALEELDKLSRDRGRLLSQTDNVALIRAGDIDIVRVGKAQLVEEAWWRYGKELRERRSRYRKATWIEMGLLGSIAIATGGGFFVYWGGGDALNRLLRWRQFGSAAWRGTAACSGCGRLMTELKFKDTKNLIIAPEPVGSEHGIALEMHCPQCRPSLSGRWNAAGIGPRAGAGGYRLEGISAQHVLRRVLAHRHFQGASDKSVRAATSLIDDVGSAEALTRRVAAGARTIASIDDRKNRTESIALEIALNDEVERRLLELELEDLEQRWREEEEIASIIDGELTPLPALEKLRRRLISQ